MIKYLFFSLILIYTALWLQINLFVSSVGQEKPPVTIIQNKDLQKLIINKTGINIESIKILESDKPFGMMVGIPTKPQLILSRKLYNTFTSNEMEYVILHEAGHYKLWHSITELVLGLLLLTIGVLTLRKVIPSSASLSIAILLGLVFGIFLIRLGRFNEYQADNYSLKRMTNPQGMITATDKFKEFYKKNYPKNKIIQFLFYRGNPYDNRIKMAEKEITDRKELIRLNKHQVIIIPGLGSSQTKLLEWATNHWKKHGLEPIIYSIGWHDSEDSFEPKLGRLVEMIDNFSDQGDTVSLVGVSAGGSAALNAFSERKDKVYRVINICGRLKVGPTKGFRSFKSKSQSSPAFAESVQLAEIAERQLSASDRQKIMTVRSMIGDELVPPETTVLRGAYNILAPTPEHILSIGTTLTVFSHPLITFLGK